MNENKTTSILQRVPVILAVTAASYGLQFPPQANRLPLAGGVAPTLSFAGAGGDSRKQSLRVPRRAGQAMAA